MVARQDIQLQLVILWSPGKIFNFQLVITCKRYQKMYCTIFCIANILLILEFREKFHIFRGKLCVNCVRLREKSLYYYDIF